MDDNVQKHSHTLVANKERSSRPVTVTTPRYCSASCAYYKVVHFGPHIRPVRNVHDLRTILFSITLNAGTKSTTRLIVRVLCLIRTYVRNLFSKHSFLLRTIDRRARNKIDYSIVSINFGSTSDGLLPLFVCCQIRRVNFVRRGWLFLLIVEWCQ